MDNGHILGNPGTQSQKLYMIYLQSGGNFGNFLGKGLGELCQNFRKNNIEWDLRKTNLRRPFCLKQLNFSLFLPVCKFFLIRTTNILFPATYASET